MSKQELYEDWLELCKVPSISESKAEIDMAETVYRLLKRMPYFVEYPEQANICAIPGDPYGRLFVYGFLAGQATSPKTVVLLSHFDVVGVDDFMQKDLAFDPITYTQFLKDNPQIQLPAQARADLASGDYLFGRGTMDMKFGIAADLAILKQAEKELADFSGNILFLSVPDEEANSAGMLAAVEVLAALKEEKQLEYVCSLVSEPHFPKYPGDSAKYIYTGTMGKLLPVFYCVGKETHVCEPFSGLNPNLLTANIVHNIEANPDFSDCVAGTFAPPPVCLKQADLKLAYSAQTSTAAYAYFNFMTLSKTPQEVMRCMLDTAAAAFAETLLQMRQNAAKRAQITGEQAILPLIEPKVISYQELYAWCLDANGEEFAAHMQKFISHLRLHGAANADTRALSVEIVKEAHKFCPYRDPLVIVFYAPPFYPHSDIPAADSRVLRTSRYIVELAKQAFSEDLHIEPFFLALSDMSYLGLSKGIDMAGLTKNFPLWNCGYHIPLETIAKLNIPALNIGPLGKDAHKFTERLCLSYSFEKTLPLLWAAVQHLLGHRTCAEEIKQFY